MSSDAVHTFHFTVLQICRLAPAVTTDCDTEIRRCFGAVSEHGLGNGSSGSCGFADLTQSKAPTPAKQMHLCLGAAS